MGVKIKKNKLKNNRSSLSLDIYHQGVSKYENLKLFIYEKATTPLEKEHSKRTLALAETIKAIILKLSYIIIRAHLKFRMGITSSYI